MNSRTHKKGFSSPFYCAQGIFSVILTKSALFIQLSHSLQDGPNVPQYFRLNQLEEECEFVSQKEFAESKRFKLIQLRDKGVRWGT